jgi:HK97 family phage major capsid protein
MNNAEMIAKQKAAMLTSIRKSIDLPMPKKEAHEFLLDVLKKASTLSKLRTRFTDVASGKLDKLGVNSRQLREHTGNEDPTGTGAIKKGQVPYAVKKVFWDEWLKNDDLWYQLARENGQNAEAAVMSLIQGQFAVDQQDLLFNGDTAATLEDGTTPHPFLSILDGFVKKMKASPYKTLLGTSEPTIQDFVNHATLLDEKYLNLPDMSWVMSRRSYQKMVAMVTNRQTALGDATIINGKLEEIAGFPIEIVQGLQTGFIALTPLSNLVPVYTREVRYTRTSEGAQAAVKDATYHILFAYVDAVVLETEAVAWMTGDKL